MSVTVYHHPGERFFALIRKLFAPRPLHIRCWAFSENGNEPCWGEMHVRSHTPGEYVYFCDGHHPDEELYKREVTK